MGRNDTTATGTATGAPLTEVITVLVADGRSRQWCVGGPTREAVDAELAAQRAFVEQRGGEIAIHRAARFVDGCWQGYLIYGPGPAGADRPIGPGPAAPRRFAD